jgi:hypothetical protein
VGNDEFYAPADGGEESVAREVLARVTEERIRRLQREREDRERDEGGL